MTIKCTEGSSAEDIDAIECITKQQIRVAQEKGELVMKGNQLDLHIRTVEQEIQVLKIKLNTNWPYFKYLLYRQWNTPWL